MIYLLLLKIIYRLNYLHPQFYDMLFYEDKLTVCYTTMTTLFIHFLVIYLINPTPHMF
jgi:hypothetical protein